MCTLTRTETEAKWSERRDMIIYHPEQYNQELYDYLATKPIDETNLVDPLSYDWGHVVPSKRSGYMLGDKWVRDYTDAVRLSLLLDKPITTC